MKGEKAVKLKAEHKEPWRKHLKRYWRLYLFMLIPIQYYIVFRYIPMIGTVIAFRKYRVGGPIFGAEWSGLRYFRQFMGDASF